MTSELSNALNPNIAQARSRQRNNYPPLPPDHVPQQQPVPVPAYVPHRSELELAITEPAYQSPRVPPSPAPSTNNALEEILRVLNESRDEAEKEKQRRIAWEKEQEEKYASRQTEMEQQLHTVKEELAVLKSTMAAPPPVAPSPAMPELRPYIIPYHPGYGISAIAPHSLPQTPLTPLSQHAYPPQATFIEGSSRYPYGPQTPSSSHDHAFLTPSISSASQAHSPAASSPMVAPSPAISDAPSTSSVNPRKRTAPPSPGSDESSDDESDGPGPEGSLPRKRLNGHDKRCLTIQHAIRVHFYKLMKIPSDKELPDSHVEGVALPDTSPIRYIWEKTSKQSPHNAAMKKRFLDDIRVRHKRLYKYVPEKDFATKTLEAAYEQAYTTLRQKYKTQKDQVLAMNNRLKEDHKNLKARRKERKKTKLVNRTDARKRIGAFSHPTFDGALQPECMSSEESCDESIESPHPSGAQTSLQVLRIRGLQWRSSRLLRFYTLLDHEENLDRNLKAKRIQPRTKERCLGPPKDGFHLPPRGVSSWMVSRKWVREAGDAHPDLGELLKGLLVDSPGFDWDHFDLLGVESEEELESHGHEEIPRSEISYSLAHALAPM
ncbi:hypothetical protein BXZ70DRAFT_405400 [Cristinia sonorae]|uniref:Uncharacterized protein n=1 Tax=Cristinia sonorae TaxID=1940300 RepID=A0A8K0UWY3_9AGAR|nr:hypothetical protein BXZ70DRAFT_405400 [Cristinia sonorae]